MTTLKQRIRNREVTIGSWLCLGSASVIEIMADAGFDWLVIDLEHSTTTVREAADMIRVADLKRVAPFVRLSGHNWAEGKRMLDAGAQGLIVPMVESGQQAREIVRGLRYSPIGRRGVGLGRAQGYGERFKEYVSRIEPATVLIAQVEDVAGIGDLDAILDVEEIDATMIGPYDLSASVGKSGQFDDRAVLSLLKTYSEVSRRRGRAMGFHVVPSDHHLVAEKIAAGYSLVAFSTDFMFLGDACRRELQHARSGLLQSGGVKANPVS